MPFNSEFNHVLIIPSLFLVPSICRFKFNINISMFWQYLTMEVASPWMLSSERISDKIIPAITGKSNVIALLWQNKKLRSFHNIWTQNMSVEFWFHKKMTFYSEKIFFYRIHYFIIVPWDLFGWKQTLQEVQNTLHKCRTSSRT